MKLETNTGPGTATLFDREQGGESVTKVHHVLVVDDDSGVRNLLTILLRGAGYRVSCAADGEAGWEALCSGGVDALITDHDMPRLSGLGLLRRVRAARRQVPVILISGRMPEGEVDLPQLLSPGFALQKPFSMAEFLAKVRSLLTTHADVIEFSDEPRPPDFIRTCEPVAVQSRMSRYG
jgi:DNA-binding response OmpR family regulator